MTQEQPPSGGCVLKPHKVYTDEEIANAAAFRRLCVETMICVCLNRLREGSRLQAAVC